jgi:hypothetical protein
MTTTIELKNEQKTTDESVEHFLRELSQLALDPTLKFAHNSFRRRIGDAAALTQAICTWAQHGSNPTLRLWTRSTDAQAETENLLRTNYGLSLLSMARGIVDDDGVDIRPDARRLAAAEIDRLFGPIDAENARRGNYIQFPCVDHSTRPANPHLYLDPTTVRREGEFFSLFKKVLHQMVSPSRRRDLTDERSQTISVLIHELFKNSHDWGRTNVDGSIVRRSFRSIIMRSMGADATEVSTSSAAIAAYAIRLGSPARTRLFEVSIVDSGPGLARRQLGVGSLDGVSLSEEFDACVACFKKHSSSSNSLERGIGLFRVWNCLRDLRGFLRVRSGRLSLEHDFTQSDGYSFARPIDGLAPVSGTAYTILVPIGGGR